VLMGFFGRSQVKNYRHSEVRMALAVMDRHASLAMTM
jgi:hypothetical protein